MSGIRTYAISGRAIWYSAGYRMSKKDGLSGQISGASLSYSSTNGTTFHLILFHFIETNVVELEPH
jgi:hypothetical protein